MVAPVFVGGNGVKTRSSQQYHRVKVNPNAHLAMEVHVGDSVDNAIFWRRVDACEQNADFAVNMHVRNIDHLGSRVARQLFRDPSRFGFQRHVANGARRLNAPGAAGKAQRCSLRGIPHNGNVDLWVDVRRQTEYTLLYEQHVELEGVACMLEILEILLQCALCIYSVHTRGVPCGVPCGRVARPRVAHGKHEAKHPAHPPQANVDVGAWVQVPEDEPPEGNPRLHARARKRIREGSCHDVQFEKFFPQGSEQGKKSHAALCTLFCGV